MCIRDRGATESTGHDNKNSSEQGHYYTQVKEVGKGSGKRKVGIICSVIVGLILVGLAGFGGGLLAADKIEDRLANNLDQMLAETGTTVPVSYTHKMCIRDRRISMSMAILQLLVALMSLLLAV